MSFLLKHIPEGLNVCLCGVWLQLDEDTMTRIRVCSQPFHVLGSWAWPCPAWSPRRLAAQLSSLANLEVGVAHDVQALLEASPEPVVPIPATGPISRLAHFRPRSRSRSPLPKAAPGRPRGSVLLNQRGPTGLSVKYSPEAPPGRSVSSCRHSCSSVSAIGFVESQGTAGVARSPTPCESRAAASTPTATVARKASQRRRASGAAE